MDYPRAYMMTHARFLSLFAIFAFAANNAHAGIIATMSYDDVDVEFFNVPEGTAFELNPTNGSGPIPDVRSFASGNGVSIVEANYETPTFAQVATDQVIFTPGDSKHAISVGYDTDSPAFGSAAGGSVSSRTQILLSGMQFSSPASVEVTVSGSFSSFSAITETVDDTDYLLTQFAYFFLNVYKDGRDVTSSFHIGGPPVGTNLFGHALCPESRPFACGALGYTSGAFVSTVELPVTSGTWDLFVTFDRFQSATVRVPEPHVITLLGMGLAAIGFARRGERTRPQ